MLKVSRQIHTSEIIYNASDQTEQIKIGATGTHQVTENYTYDNLTGLLTNQNAVKNGQTLLDLSYDYARNNAVGNANGKTGHLTKITDHLNNAKNKEYEFDALGRLTKAKGGNSLWQQNYSYDRYGNRTNVTATGNGIDNAPIPLDGIPNLTYNTTNNRITTSGFEYDVAGNQTRAKAEDGVSWLRYEYDAANRLQIVKQDNGTNLQSFQYGATNQRLMDYDFLSGQLKIFGSSGAVEYTEYTPAVMTWTKSYVYLGDSVLSTIKPDGNNAETVEYNHPDRLGTKLTTNQQSGTSLEQASLPFGTALNAETTRGESKRFTSYERSQQTGLDYAVNRTYDSKLGRFTQVDPIGMSAVDFNYPQTFNLYNYCGNDPINHTDPDGLFWGKLKKFFASIGKILKHIAVVAAIVIAIVTIVTIPSSAPFIFKLLTTIGSIANAASAVLDYLGLKTAANILGIVAAVTSLGTSMYQKVGTTVAKITDWTKKAIYKVVASTATLASKVLGALGHSTVSRIFALGATVANFAESGFNADKPKDPWKKSGWKWFKFSRDVSGQIATIVKADDFAGFINLFGLAEDGFEFYGLITKGLPKFPVLNPVIFSEKAQSILRSVWKGTFIAGRIVSGIKVAHRSFGRIDKFVLAVR